jgi:hypothetical protein
MKCSCSVISFDRRISAVIDNDFAKHRLPSSVTTDPFLFAKSSMVIESSPRFQQIDDIDQSNSKVSSKVSLGFEEGGWVAADCRVCLSFELRQG